MKRSYGIVCLLCLLLFLVSFQSCRRCRECYYSTHVSSPDTSYTTEYGDPNGAMLICNDKDIPDPTTSYDSVTQTTYTTHVRCN